MGFNGNSCSISRDKGYEKCKCTQKANSYIEYCDCNGRTYDQYQEYDKFDEYQEYGEYDKFDSYKEFDEYDEFDGAKEFDGYGKPNGGAGFEKCDKCQKPSPCGQEWEKPSCHSK